MASVATTPPTAIARDTVNRRAKRVLVALVVGYAGFYLCRSNLDSALPLWTRELGLDEARLGVVVSAAMIAHAVGKLVLGAVGDAIGGRRVLLLALVGSIASTFAIATFGALGLGALVACAALNRFFQAGAWGGMVQLVARRFPAARHGHVMGVLATSYELGSVVALLACSAIVHLRTPLGWRALFVVNPILLAIVWMIVAPAIESPHASHVPEIRPAPFGGTVRALARKPAFWIALALSMLLTFVRVGLLTWTPTFFAASSSSIAASIAKSAIFPGAGVIAALVAGRLSDRFGPGRRAPVVIASLAALVVASIALARIAHAGHGGSFAALGALFACGLFLLGPYSLVVGAIPVDVANGRGIATATGTIDGIGYVGGSIAGVLLGTLASRHGWGAAFDALTIASVLALVAAVGGVFVVGRAQSDAR